MHTAIVINASSDFETYKPESPHGSCCCLILTLGTDIIPVKDSVLTMPRNAVLAARLQNGAQACYATANAATAQRYCHPHRVAASSPGLEVSCWGAERSTMKAQLKFYLHIVITHIHARISGKNIYMYFVHGLTIRVHKAGADLSLHY